MTHATHGHPRISRNTILMCHDTHTVLNTNKAKLQLYCTTLGALSPEISHRRVRYLRSLRYLRGGESEISQRWEVSQDSAWGEIDRDLRDISGGGVLRSSLSFARLAIGTQKNVNEHLLTTSAGRLGP